MDFDDFALNAPDDLLFMEQNDPDKFNELVEAKIKAVRLSGVIEKSEAFEVLKLDAKAIGKQSSQISFDDFALNAPGALQLMKQESPELFNKLLNEKVTSIRLNNPHLFEA